MQSYLEKFGNNFIVSAFIPSLAFVSSVMIVFRPLIPQKVVELLESVFNPIEGISGLWVFLIAIILGFTLSSLNTFIYKIYEGYFVLEKFKGPRTREQDRAAHIKESIGNLMAEMQSLDEQGVDINDPQYQQLLDREYYLRSQLDSQFPTTANHLLPTRFGNMFKAMEVYPGERYGIDAVTMWPRLIHVIPELHFSRIDRSNNQLAFLINCSVLSFAFMIISLGAASYQYFSFNFAREHELVNIQSRVTIVAPTTSVFHTPTPSQLFAPAAESVSSLPQPPEDTLLYFIRINLPSYVYMQRMWIYLVFGLFAFVMGWFFYRASLPIVSQYSSLVRASFDMFRFDLLKQFHQELPQKTEDEFELWKKFSKHFVSGYFSKQAQFEYIFPPEKS